MELPPLYIDVYKNNDFSNSFPGKFLLRGNINTNIESDVTELRQDAGKFHLYRALLN